MPLRLLSLSEKMEPILHICLSCGLRTAGRASQESLGVGMRGFQYTPSPSSAGRACQLLSPWPRLERSSVHSFNSIHSLSIYSVLGHPDVVVTETQPVPVFIDVTVWGGGDRYQ